MKEERLSQSLQTVDISSSFSVYKPDSTRDGGRSIGQDSDGIEKACEREREERGRKSEVFFTP